MRIGVSCIRKGQKINSRTRCIYFAPGNPYCYNTSVTILSANGVRNLKAGDVIRIEVDFDACSIAFRSEAGELLARGDPTSVRGGFDSSLDTLQPMVLLAGRARAITGRQSVINDGRVTLVNWDAACS